MANRTIGVDTSTHVTDELVASATHALQTAPLFWGRYFTRPQEEGSVEYRHAIEDPILGPKNIRVLPIARQTLNVGGTLAQGTADGAANAADLLATFGEDYLVAQGGKFFIFLDVEATRTGGPSLSVDYYTGWTRGLANASQAVEFLPCIYARPDDRPTWTALQSALSNGVSCCGLWLAYYLNDVQEPVSWDEAALQLKPDPGAVTLLWQYDASGTFDRDLVNPAIDAQNDFLAYLVLPPTG